LNGAAYLGKAIMFPLAFGFLAILFFSRKRSKTTIYGVLLAFITFLAVSSPFIYALSRAKGRFTTGETGKLAYSAMVNGSEQIHWQGEPPGSGIPLHTTRKLLDSPPIFEFAEPIRGTYPPWDDPSYWNEGTRWTFRLRSQIRVLLQSALAYEKLVLDESGLLAGAFIFLFLGGSKTRKGILQNWPLLAAAGLSLAAYSFVLVIPRYVGGSLVVFWVAIFAGVRLPNASLMLRNSKYVAAAVSLTVIFSAMANIGDSAYKQWTVTVDPSSKDQVMAAVGLQAMGLRGGDEVAVIGRGFVNHWARLGHFRIVAEAVAPGLPAREFWAAPAERRELAYQCLKSTGARVVVAWDPPASAKSDARWHHIPGSDFYAFFLSQ
jgi:hypothetical protein